MEFTEYDRENNHVPDDTFRDVGATFSIFMATFFIFIFYDHCFKLDLKSNKQKYR